jgi:hypothetical protein
MLRTGCYVDFLKFNRGDKLAATTGDLLYFTGETLTVLPAGPAGQVLTSAGPGNPPVFGPAGGAVPDPLSLNRLNVNELSNFTNPGGAVRAVTPITLDYVSTGLAFGPGAGLAITTATNYTGIGSGALAALTTGADNTALGRNALAAAVNGFSNTAIGSNALASVIAGSNNTSLGLTSGTGVIAGNANTMIGQAAGSTVDVSNTVVVGQNAQAGANDVIVIGRAATGLVAGNIQIGANAVFSGTAQTRMRSQIVSDEAWIGSPIGYTQIDAAGNITKLVSPDLPILGEVGEFLTAPTIDATPTVLQTYATVINSTRRISAKVVGHRTGGAAGAPNDTFSVQIDSLIKNNAGVVTANTTNSIQIKDQISWVVEFFISGTNAQLRVTGAINNNITWNAWVLKFSTI